MIQNVRTGQKLTSGLLNTIIAQANGQDIPSNQNFVNTDKGPLFISNHDYEVAGLEGTFNKFLECWVDNAPELKSQPDEYVKSDDGSLNFKPYIFINLGNSTADACKNITVNNKPISNIVLISSKEDLDVVVSDDILSKNYYVQLAEVDSTSDTAYDVHFILVKVLKTNYGQGTSPEVLGYVLVISKEDSSTTKTRAQTKINEIAGFQDADELQIINEKKILATTSTDKKINQNVIGTQDITDNILSSDSAVSDEGQGVKQYSIEISSALVEENTENDIIFKDVPYVGLYKFNKKEQDLGFVLNAEHPAISSDYQILVKDKSSDIHYLKYATLSIDLSGGSLVDTEISDLNLSSIDKKKTDDDSRTYLTLHNFDKSDKDLTLSISHETPNLPENIQLLVRDSDGGTKELKYADLSIDFQNISTDTQVTNNQSSIDMVHSDELSGDYLQLYNFDKDQAGTYKFLPNKQGYECSSGSTSCNFVCKSVDGANKKVEYMDTTVEYPEGDNHSIVYNKSNDLAYFYELYSFSRHSTTPIEIYVNNINGPLTATSISPGYEFLAKGPGGNLEYIDLQLGVGDRVYSDSEFNDTSKTIETKYHSGAPYFCLYGIDNAPKQLSVTLVENGTVDTGIKYVSLNDNKETEIAELKIRLPDLSTGTITNNITEICTSISVISGDLENNTQAIEELYGQVDELSTKVDGLSGGLSGEYWKLGGSYSDCRGSSIGDSSSQEAINLDNKQLVGQWQATQVEVAQSLTASTVIANDMITSGGIMAGTTVQAAEMTCGNQLRIGSTTINEEQLTKLLALIANT